MSTKPWKAAIALLADRHTSNYVTRLAWRIHRRYGTSLDARRIPPHVSLKQPFAVDDLSELEDYVSAFAATVPPLTVRLSELQLIPAEHEGQQTGILWFAVEEHEPLRALHERLNHELTIQFGDTDAPFDGPDYRFHMTVLLGEQSLSLYRQIYSDVAKEALDFSCRLSELVLCTGDQNQDGGWVYTVYQTFPLGTVSTGASGTE